eukprot:TRINITY_DN23949_c0_g1_i1.p1 TRINITY_DN23949_c0_g1~~TRINITY_DN23949_c0_g1_i1.p1  ORF type:complete len:292 (+),score=49.21 TRINITY_DN23949_c0_g1_i1:74-949(+)
MLHRSNTVDAPVFGKWETESSSVSQELALWSSALNEVESVGCKSNAADVDVHAHMEKVYSFGDLDVQAPRVGERLAKEEDGSSDSAKRLRLVGDMEKIFTFGDIDNEVMWPGERAEKEGITGVQLGVFGSVACGSGAQAVSRLRTLAAAGGNRALPPSPSMAQSTKAELPSRHGGSDRGCFDTVAVDAQPRRSIEPEPRATPGSALTVVAPTRRSPKPEPRAVPPVATANIPRRRSVKPEPRKRPGGSRSRGAEVAADVASGSRAVLDADEIAPTREELRIDGSAQERSLA